VPFGVVKSFALRMLDIVVAGVLDGAPAEPVIT
jgi:hypothetical protein